MTPTVAVLLPTPGEVGDFVRRCLEEAQPEQIVSIGPSGPELNEAVAATPCDRVWIHDPCLWLPFAEILAEIRRRPQLLLFKPFRSYRQLDQRQTEAFVERGQFPEGEPPRSLGTAFGKASYVISRQLFDALGGVSPRFRGSSLSGLELAGRARAHFPEPERLEEVEGLALYRPRSPQEKEIERLDQELPKVGPLLPGGQTELATLIRNHAWQVTCPTPPPLDPVSLPGRLWAITTFFNPHGYANKKENYVRFREGLRRVGVPLCTVELAFEQRPWELGSRDAEKLLQMRGGDVLWQKERLLNFGIARLPADCDKVAWLDADILFTETAWAERTAQLLEQYAVVQLFTQSVRLLPGELTTPLAPDELPLGSGEHQVLHGLAWGVARRGLASLARYHEHGHSGYAWAGRRAILEKHGLYEANILGNADLNIAQALLSGCRHLRLERFSPSARRHLMHWAERIYADVRGSVGWVEGLICHLWHGNKSDRLYDSRLSVLIEHDFDPLHDLEIGEEGCFYWSSPKPGLHAWCRDYFELRKEEIGT